MNQTVPIMKALVHEGGCVTGSRLSIITGFPESRIKFLMSHQSDMGRVRVEPLREKRGRLVGHEYRMTQAGILWVEEQGE